MKIIDQKAWDKWVKNNPDPYGSAVIRYAEAWANLMESEIAAGKEIPDIARRTSHDADTEGITGFMYGCAVKILAQCWEHGEQLRRWHNGEYGYHGDGVVNPAILTIQTK